MPQGNEESKNHSLQAMHFGETNWNTLESRENPFLKRLPHYLFDYTVIEFQRGAELENWWGVERTQDAAPLKYKPLLGIKWPLCSECLAYYKMILAKLLKKTHMYNGLDLIGCKVIWRKKLSVPVCRRFVIFSSWEKSVWNSSTATTLILLKICSQMKCFKFEVWVW